MSNAPVDINQVKQSAATGHFRSIALWLNYPLVPQGIYAQIQPHPTPGYLQVLLEFERSPNKDALIRLVCHRICSLNANVIRGLQLVGRHIGAEQPLWQQRVRLNQRQAQQPSPQTQKIAAPELATEQQQVTSEAPSSEPPNTNSSHHETITTVTYGGETLNTVPSYLIPKISTAQDRRRRSKRNVTQSTVVHIRPADISSSPSSTRRRRHKRQLNLIPQEVLEQQFRYVRAMVVTGSAAAAFILGCVTEVFISQRGQIVHQTSPTLPTLNEGWRPLNEVEAQEIAYRSAMRRTSVPAALETVAVIPHEATNDPEDPTVTLVFGGDVAVGEVPLQTPDAIGEVLGDLEVFREADVAMVGLGNTLASADTSLQESYLERTRPDAVDALQQGGIDIVSLTGDRTMDFGRQGLTETLDSLDSAGIYRVGAGRDSQEARRPEILDIKGQRIAYLSYAPEGRTKANLNKAGLNIQEPAGILEDISALRQDVDWIVVNYRWQGELTPDPNQEQIELSRSAIDAGADLVVGYHPQQLQGAELYNSRPIVYALGDFIFQDAPLEDHDTASLRVSLRDQQMKVEFLPVSVKEARPQEASGEKAKAILQQIRQASKQLPSPLQFPAILDATPRSEHLPQPEQPKNTPVKTLGELEPPQGTADGLNSWPNSPIEDSVKPNLDDAEIFDTAPIEIRPIEAPIFNTTPDSSKPTITESPLDTFKVQPNQTIELIGPDRFDESIPQATPAELQEKPVETAPVDELRTTPPKFSPEPLPSEPVDETDTDSFIESEDVNITPDTTDINVVSPKEQRLPGYDSLDDWGEKESPHKEFNPIHDNLNSLTAPESNNTSNLSATQTEEEIGYQEASKEKDVMKSDDALRRQPADSISPHDEPLVGPLSYQAEPTDNQSVSDLS
ncbi:MAG: CapA family protein [Cyanobacteria bacterium P01_D01_bin.156]